MDKPQDPAAAETAQTGSDPAVAPSTPCSVVTSEELKLILDATVRLIELRQRGCAHLCVENLAPELMHRLLTRLRMHKAGLESLTGFERFEKEWPESSKAAAILKDLWDNLPNAGHLAAADDGPNPT